MSEHERFQDDLPLYATGDLDAERTASLAAHLDGCAECVAELAGLKATLGGLQHVVEREDEDVDLGGLWAERIEPRVAPRRMAWLVRAAAILLAFFAGMAVGPGTPPETAEDPVVAVTDPEPSREELAYRQAAKGETGLSRAIFAMASLAEQDR